MNIDFDKTFNNNRRTIQLDDNEYSQLAGNIDKPTFRRFDIKFPDEVQLNSDSVKIGDTIEILGVEFTVLKVYEDSLEIELKEE